MAKLGFKVGLYQNSNAKSIKMAKIEIANTQLSVCLKQFFVFPEHYVFCVCEVLTRCHRYTDIVLRNRFLQLKNMKILMAEIDDCIGLTSCLLNL